MSQRVQASSAPSELLPASCIQTGGVSVHKNARVERPLAHPYKTNILL